MHIFERYKTDLANQWNDLCNGIRVSKLLSFNIRK